MCRPLYGGEGVRGGDRGLGNPEWTVLERRGRSPELLPQHLRKQRQVVWPQCLMPPAHRFLPFSQDVPTSPGSRIVSEAALTWPLPVIPLLLPDQPNFPRRSWHTCRLHGLPPAHRGGPSLPLHELLVPKERALSFPLSRPAVSAASASVEASLLGTLSSRSSDTRSPTFLCSYLLTSGSCSPVLRWLLFAWGPARLSASLRLLSPSSHHSCPGL